MAVEENKGSVYRLVNGKLFDDEVVKFRGCFEIFKGVRDRVIKGRKLE